MKYIRRHLISLKPPPLGRWCHRDKSKNDWKIDMANIDHCGTCANEATKTFTEKSLTKENKLTN